jgi:protein transport protein SEC61 subunit gamma-like protein
MAMQQIKSFLLKCKRVWFALKKPSKEEFTLISKVSAIGVLLLGIFGFAISLIMKLFF